MSIDEIEKRFISAAQTELAQCGHKLHTIKELAGKLPSPVTLRARREALRLKLAAVLELFAPLQQAVSLFISMTMQAVGRTRASIIACERELRLLPFKQAWRKVRGLVTFGGDDAPHDPHRGFRHASPPSHGRRLLRSVIKLITFNWKDD